MSSTTSSEATNRAGVFQASLDVVKLTAARGEIEQYLELVTDALPVLIAHVGRDLTYLFVNRAYEEWFGISRKVIKGQHIKEVISPEAFELVKPHIDSVLAGIPTSFEARIPRKSGFHRDIYAQYVPQLSASGEVQGYFAITQDLTEIKEQAGFLAQREQYLRDVLDSITDCFYAVDREWCITLFNRAAERYYGRTRKEVLGLKIWEAFPAHLGSVYEQHQQQVMEERVPVTFEARSVVFPDRYIEMRVSPMEDGGLAVSLSDITCRKAQEHQRNLLIHEMNHRVKNTLAVVQSIAAKTFSDPQTSRTGREAFEGRLMALAAAHDLLTQGSWEAASLGDLVRSALRPFGIEHRLEISGPELRVRSQAAVNLTLALHELATNAGKYGSLSNRTGTVAITWSISGGEPPMFQMAWQERGGPEVALPTRAGFGSRLVKQALSGELGGPVSLDYAPDGLVCTIEAPMANLEAR